MKIQIGDQYYDLDVAMAKETGVLKALPGPIDNFELGDVFECPGSKIAIFEFNFKDGIIIGEQLYDIRSDNYGVKAHSNYPHGATKNEIIRHLNHNEYKFVGQS